MMSQKRKSCTSWFFFIKNPFAVVIPRPVRARGTNATDGKSFVLYYLTKKDANTFFYNMSCTNTTRAGSTAGGY